MRDRKIQALLLHATHADHAANLICLLLLSYCVVGESIDSAGYATMQTLATSKTIIRGLVVLFMLAAAAGYSSAQSTDIAWPSPVRSNDVRGIIPARDLGDPRVTDHFYAFIANPGDLLITVDSRNLNGDIDVFPSSSLRPLLKFTVYAGSSSPITKGLYLRRQESLILRVEGRTPDDDDAVYRLHFGGAFEPITSGPLAEHEDALEPATTAATSNKGDRRVSSVGARINEPPKEVAETPTETPSPITSSEPEPKPAAAKPATRNTRTRGTVARRTRPARTPPKPKPADAEKPDETVAKGETGEKPTTESSATETPTTAPARPARRSMTARATKPPAPQESEDTGPRLVIESSDGTLVDRSMGGVRRVTVENGQVVVIGRDGKIQRIPLASVVRMTIAP